MKSKTIDNIINDKKKFDIIAKSSFDLVDQDGSGFIDSAELKNVLTNLANDIGNDPPTEEELKQMLKLLDTDGSGKIEYNEFQVLIRDILETLLEADYWTLYLLSLDKIREKYTIFK